MILGCPLVSLPMLVVMSRMGDIGFGVFGLMDPCLYSTELEQFYDVSLICIFPWYRPSVLVIMSRMMRSVYLAELVYLIGICYLPFWLELGYLYPLFLYVTDDMRLVII